MKKFIRLLITLIIIVAAILAGRWVWNYYLYSPWTRDGRVRANIITIAPDVSGWVTHLNVTNNQSVKKGQSLFIVDDARYKATFAKDEANVENKRYAWKLAEHKYLRRKRLKQEKAISAEDLETARINTKLAYSNYQLAQAELKSAQINLTRTRVSAPIDGSIINLSLQQDNYVSRGKPVLAIVKAHSFYVTGYFEETKLQLIHKGQTARIILMGGAKPLQGTVISIGHAIANNNDNSNQQLLPKVQQTFNWVRLAQRIPVDIRINHLPKGVKLSAGMTVSIYLNND
ncbi:MAG: p-hydroxybenzoic acid efflux pump subunit AaeA [Candidatus Celerinatantimonas neptuna]|nr:MAG: p-hydroxybenzoic acid efflux pump subunit AaeA [Candidatus Celerinatantimonas neptuna]